MGKKCLTVLYIFQIFQWHGNQCREDLEITENMGSLFMLRNARQKNQTWVVIPTI